jgi:hypothetical protein
MEIVNKSLHRRIMYRVYLSFAISIAEHRFFWQGFLFGAALALFGRLVHVAAITDNVLSTPMAELPQYVTVAFKNAFSSGEFLTILVTLIMLTIGLSFVRTFVRLSLLERSRRLA